MLTITDLRDQSQRVEVEAEAVDNAFQAHAVHQEVAKVAQTKDWGIPVNITVNVDHPSILGCIALAYSSKKTGTSCSQGTRSNWGS